MDNRPGADMVPDTSEASCQAGAAAPPVTKHGARIAPSGIENIAPECGN